MGCSDWLAGFGRVLYTLLQELCTRLECRCFYVFLQCIEWGVSHAFLAYLRKLICSSPTCADPWLLQDVLRDHWQWTNEQQWITSDCDAVQNVFLPHGYTMTREEAVAIALKAGTDIDCGKFF